MDSNVVTGVEMPFGSGRTDATDGARPIRMRLFGPIAIWRDGRELALPASRKVRALLAYLALAQRAETRSRLCELLWEAPSDPRGELRWCLSKIRGLVDDGERRRVQTRADTVSLDLADCLVDAIEVAKAAGPGAEALDRSGRQRLCELIGGDFLEGLEVDRSPVFDGWLAAQRRRFRDLHAGLLARLADEAPGDEAFTWLDRLLRLSPFDARAHEAMLAALARRGRMREGEEHLAAAVRLFEAEGLDCTPLRDAWRAARARAGGPPGAGAGSLLLPAQPAEAIDIAAAAQRRASLAVMPFVDESAASGTRGGTAGALVHDVITRLAKLRSLFVIAQGTVFALHERLVSPQDAGRLLDVDYIASGSVRHDADRLSVSVELAETRSARIVWAEIFDHRADDALLVLDEIGNRIVASIASEIETIERNRAILKPPDSLDAWEAHHRGLWHMYRFSKADNEHARHFFETAVRLDPTFARAWAGLSFTHFQNAFQRWTDREHEIERALETAGQSLLADDRDPAAHWAMGRALWLRDEHGLSVVELEQAIDLSPNFALGHYTLAFVHSQSGDPLAAITSADQSRHLSPFDPLLFGMLGARAMALVRLGRFDEAAGWATKAAARPNAHAHILAIAAFTLALAGSLDEARKLAAAIRRAIPRYGIADFLAAFHFEPHGAALFREGARRLGMT